MNDDAIVITGFGAVTPLGHSQGFEPVPGKPDYIGRMLKGESGMVSPVGLPRFLAEMSLTSKTELAQFLTDVDQLYPLASPDDVPINAVGLVPGCSYFDLQERLGRQRRKKLKFASGRPAQLGVMATAYAVDDAGLTSGFQPQDVGVFFAADRGALPMKDWETVGRRSIIGGRPDYWMTVKACKQELDPMWPFYVMTNSAAANVALLFDFLGPNNTTSSACAAGLFVLWEAYRNLKEGRIKAAVVGGADSKLSAWDIAGFLGLTAASTRRCAPEEACAPCSKHRDGMVTGEGAACFILERLADAKARNAKIYAEVSGFGAACGAGIVETDPDAVARTVREACRDARINYDQIGMFSPHATSTPSGDWREVSGIRQALGADADKPWAYNSKGGVGHWIVPAGFASVAPAVLALYRGVIPPNVNLTPDTLDPACNLRYTMGSAVEADVQAALVLALGFGNTDVACVLKKV